jgi:hypothetical protein
MVPPSTVEVTSAVFVMERSATGIEEVGVPPPPPPQRFALENAHASVKGTFG